MTPADGAVAAVLAAMPNLRELCLGQMQGSGEALAPLAAMPALHRLRLVDCHLTDADQIAAELAAAAASLQSLTIQVGRSGCHLGW